MRKNLFIAATIACLSFLPSAEAGIESFMNTYGIEGDWKSLSYHVIKSYPDIDRYVEENEPEMKELVVFGIPA